MKYNRAGIARELYLITQSKRWKDQPYFTQEDFEEIAKKYGITVNSLVMIFSADFGIKAEHTIVHKSLWQSKLKQYKII